MNTKRYSSVRIRRRSFTIDDRARRKRGGAIWSRNEPVTSPGRPNPKRSFAGLRRFGLLRRISPPSLNLPNAAAGRHDRARRRGLSSRVCVCVFRSTRPPTGRAIVRRINKPSRLRYFPRRFFRVRVSLYTHVFGDILEHTRARPLQGYADSNNDDATPVPDAPKLERLTVA